MVANIVNAAFVGYTVYNIACSRKPWYQITAPSKRGLLGRYLLFIPAAYAWVTYKISATLQFMNENKQELKKILFAEFQQAIDNREKRYLHMNNHQLMNSNFYINQIIVSAVAISEKW